MLPIVDDIFCSRSTGRTRFLASESLAPGRNLANGLRVLSDRNRSREETPSPEKSQTVMRLAMLLLSILVVILYAPVLGPLARQWWDDSNYSHGAFVPVFAGYVLWRERDRWRAITSRTSDSGFPIMLFAVGLLTLGTLGAELYTARVSLLILVSGLIVFLAGWQALRSVAFPIGYLAFMIPLPAIVYYQLTFPLQLWASRLGADGLVALGVRTVREGNLLILPNSTLEVVDACSGVRSLLSLLAAVVAYGYLAEPSIWKRCVLAVSTIPVVIVSNGLRLVATGVLTAFFGPRADLGAVHLGLGLAFFVLAFFSILLIHALLRFLPSHQNPVPVHS
jgi:exosortase